MLEIQRKSKKESDEITSRHLKLIQDKEDGLRKLQVCCEAQDLQVRTIRQRLDRGRVSTCVFRRRGRGSFRGTTIDKGDRTKVIELKKTLSCFNAIKSTRLDGSAVMFFDGVRRVGSFDKVTTTMIPTSIAAQSRSNIILARSNTDGVGYVLPDLSVRSSYL